MMRSPQGRFIEWTSGSQALALIERLKTAGHTGDAAIRIRLQKGGIRRSVVASETDLKLSEEVRG